MPESFLGRRGTLPLMRAASAHWIVLAVAVSAVAASAPPHPKTLYEQHRWVELREALAKGGPALYRGAVANAFNDPAVAEGLLRSVIKSNPRSEEADEAHKMLSRLYMRMGRYHTLARNFDEWSAAFPNRSDLPAERADVAGFRGLPDQTANAPQASTLRHDGSIFLPLSIDGGSAKYFFDTGAWLSCMSESEAKRLGLAIRDSPGTLGTTTGASIGFRTAVAGEVIVGKTHLRNVSFAVFPDDQEPWSQLPPGQRGILGIPVLLAVRTWRWAIDGSLEIGMDSGRGDPSKTNLVFDDNHLLVAMHLQGRRIFATLDTGAETTDLYGAFAEEFAALIKGAGGKDSTEVRGIGHAETFDSVTLPELTFLLGGAEASLRPAHVILKRMGAPRCVGNVGLDLLRQADAFRIDFSSMSLMLERRP